MKLIQTINEYRLIPNIFDNNIYNKLIILKKFSYMLKILLSIFINHLVVKSI